jgi:hypothetical protein
MKSVILFGGGDGGGFIITENGVRPIPPFDPLVLRTLKSTAGLVTAASIARGDKASGKLAKAAANLANIAVEQVENVVGPLEGPYSLVFQDDDGGFTCGSTGKPPVPLPWPPNRIPSISDVLSAGVVESDLVAFVRAVRESKVPLTEAFERPAEVAKKLHLSLSSKSVKDLQVLAPSHLSAIKDPTEREIVSFFQKVAQDGRYLDTWFSRPYEVSQEVKAELSDEALNQLVSNSFGGESPGDSAIVAGVAWGVVCIIIGGIVAKDRPIDAIVRDRSGLAKF